MASGVGGSRPPIIDTEGDGVVLLTVVDDSVPVAYGVRAEKSRTQPEGPPTDVS